MALYSSATYFQTVINNCIFRLDINISLRWQLTDVLIYKWHCTLVRESLGPKARMGFTFDDAKIAPTLTLRLIDDRSLVPDTCELLLQTAPCMLRLSSLIIKLVHDYNWYDVQMLKSLSIIILTFLPAH